MEAKNSNVIQFPGRKLELAPPPSPQPQPEPTQKRAAARLMSSLFATLVAVVIANRIAPEDSAAELSSTAGGRGLASVGERVIEPGDRDANWEKQLARDLSTRSRRELASLQVGQRPTAEERLRFGTLKSQYTVLLDNGKLREIRLPTGEPAVFISDRVEFISDYRELMPVEFSAAVAERREASAEGIFETYKLVNRGHLPVAEATFGMDRFGRLIHFSITPTSVQ